MDVHQPTLVGLDVPVFVSKPSRRKELRVRELAHWAERQLGWLARKSQTDRRSELFLYIQAAKLVEEVGELHAALLGRSKLQRRGKASDYDQANLEGELADVVICVSILAQTLGVDLTRALLDKMDVVDGRVEQSVSTAG